MDPQPDRPNKFPPKNPVPFDHPDRGKPSPGVYDAQGHPTLVFVTVGTKYRKPWLATKEYQRLLTEVWSSATYWRVGRYVIMPDHVHFFAAPFQPDFAFENWMKYW